MSATAAMFAFAVGCVARPSPLHKALPQSLEGSWRVVALNLDGHWLPEKDLKQCCRYFVFGNGGLKILFDGDSIVEKYSDDPSKMPHTLDTSEGSYSSFGLPAPSQPAIYKIENNCLILRFPYSDSHVRPTDFSVGADMKGSLAVLERTASIKL